MPETIHFDEIAPEESLARQVGEMFMRWETARASWWAQKRELRNYLFATDTSTTTNARLPWKNSTTRPKLTQLRDLLHANYMQALFPNSDWLAWEGNDEDSASKEKVDAIQNYMRTKTDHDRFRSVVSLLVLDWIDTGNAIATATYVNEKEESSDDTPEGRPGYQGPVAVRLPVRNTVFDPLAPRFENTPKIVRTLMTVGDLRKEIEENPEKGYLEGAFDKLLKLRRRATGAGPESQFVRGSSQGDQAVSEALTMDGFGSFHEYLLSNYVEVLDVYGTVYDNDMDTLLRDHVITVVDRAFVLRSEPIPSWLKKDAIVYSPWRQRPDNLYGMGPLDNLVGMQYRIDHLENLKADVFDLIAVPTIVIKGQVQDFEYGPDEKIFAGDDGSVEFIRPPVEALNANIQIAELEQEMELMAGAPKEAMGFRTPGEKTKFEVQRLDNAAQRIFLNKVKLFEENVLGPLLNLMLEHARRNMDGVDVARVVDEFGAVVFSSITKEDLVADGRLRPLGARRFEERANKIQNLTGIMGSVIGQDDDVKVHISGLKLAQAIEELMEIESMQLVSPNIRITERMETARLVQAAQEQVDVEAQTPAGVTEDDVGDEARALAAGSV